VLLVGLFAGVWVDRLHRRPILILVDLARGLLLLSIPAAALLGVLRIEQLYLIAAAVGGLTVLFSVAYVAYLPTLVERRNMLEGNSKLAFTDSLAEILGPGLAGVLVQALTAPMAILVDALTFFVSAASLMTIRKLEPAAVLPKARQPALKEFIEGLRAVLSNSLLRTLGLVEGSLSFFGNFYATLYALFAIREVGLTPAALGVTIAAGGVGSLLGALLVVPVVRWLGLGRALISVLVLQTFVALLIPLAPQHLIGGMAVLIAAQLFGDSLRTVYFINSVSLRQAVTPDRILGRVNASMELLTAGIGPLGALTGGLLAEWLGMRPTLVIAAFGALLGSLWLLFSRVRLLQDHPHEAQSEA
jgi:predicted MFS family arabinose efflux permease